MPPEAEHDRISLAFARVLRGAGLNVPVGSTITFAEALAAVGLDRRDDVYWAGRVTLLRTPEDGDLYDRAFDAFWDGRVEITAPATAAPPLTLAFDADRDESDDENDTTEIGPTMQVRYSRAEVLRHRDFAAYTHAELAEARRLMTDLRLAGALRRSRRRRPTNRERGRPDLRRTVRRSLRSGGEPIDRAFSAPSRRPRRIVLLCDVSGSMEAYSRALLRFVQAAVVGRGRVEAFALGTRLTRITRELSSRDPDAALAAAADRVLDWSGGTRLGDGLREFNDRWGVRGMARGAVVVVLSDGWDRGDPDTLGEEMARLARVAHRIVWVNPLKATPEYAPLARGMAAALPHVDDFIAGHSMAALEELAAVIAK
ncbi:MAG: VWA domain-containing protein [Acidimicrobiia bacterium]|nr:VWA domain-containing protein [Acidimicrobiia bacterium]